MKNFRFIFIAAILLCAIFTANASAAPVKVGIVNLSNEPDSDVQKITETLQIQVTRDFSPAYKIESEVKFYPANETIPADVWKIYLVQKYNFPELGFHYVDSGGTPAARVSLERSLENGKPASLVLSHELLEMLANPFVDRSVVVSQPDSDAVEIFLFEVSDAVMSVDCGYKIENVLVSDFVFPQWFDRNSPATGKFSFNNCARSPLEIAGRGYMPFMKLFKKKKGYAVWSRKF